MNASHSTMRLMLFHFGMLTFVLTTVAASEDKTAPVTLHCDLDATEALVGDPVFVCARLRNETSEVVDLFGGVPTIESGGIAFQWRKADQGLWTTFNASQLTIEPGVRNPGAVVKMHPGQQLIYYQCLAYHRLPPPPRGLPTPRSYMLALYEAGDFEFRAVAQIGDYSPLYSKSVRLSAREPSEGRWVALELGAELIEKATAIESPGLRIDDTYNAERVQQYLGDSRAAWLLQWKAAWATWLETDNLVKSPAGRSMIIAMRDDENDVAREILTLSLARGYLKVGNLGAARREAEALPKGSLDRHVLLLRIADAEKSAARRTP